MAKVPNHDQAIVPQEKVVDYLLSETHPDGKGKAIFFKKFGFSVESWETLAQALIEHISECEVSKATTNQHGTKYVVEGVFKTPDKRNPLLRSVWIIENEQTQPRIVTAYPMED